MGADKVVVLGGDGFCGWPTALHLSEAGYDVTIVDDYSRRRIDEELGSNSLTPIVSMDARVAAWRQVSGGKLIAAKNMSVGNYNGLKDVLRKIRPMAVIHFAKQRAAPYSMKDAATKRYTVTNNVTASHNLLCAIVETGLLDTHIIHLGTMGVYGYGTGGITIPEGYLDAQLVDVVTKEKIAAEIYYPPDPGSIYHMTKVMDTMMFYYYCKNDALRITDLHQGIVWGASTINTARHPDLINRFDYDGDYGTVLNRFLIQGSMGHPLTVYGTGGQTRAFIHIQNMCDCIKLALESPPDKGARVRVWNQTTEQLNLMDLAKMVSKVTGAEIRLYSNPRVEADSNKLSACMDNIHGMGLNPIHVAEDVLAAMGDLVRTYAGRIKADKIFTTSMWRKDRAVDRKGKAYA